MYIIKLFRTLVLLVVLCSFTVVGAGSGTATLTCRSASGRTMFTAYLQDIIGMFEGGKLMIDGVVQEFHAEDGDDCAEAVWDPEIGVFTVTYSHDTPEGPVWFRFWAVPNTFKTISDKRGSAEGAVYEFDG
ncbi:MAG: hypothetical protein KF797_10115, partial [Flavobacteriales bacterium]|nr:hypothetical protein [Flavobacteriales bacterium]